MKIVRLLKSIGIALICFGGLTLIIWGFMKYTKIAAVVVLVLIFIWTVWRIYEDGDFQ